MKLLTKGAYFTKNGYLKFQHPLFKHFWKVLQKTFFFKLLLGGGSFWNFHKKGGSDFSIKNEGVVKIEWIVSGVSLIFILTLSSIIVLSVWYVLFIYTVPISIVCVSREELTLTESNQQIHGFYKWVIFEKQRHCGKYLFNVIMYSIDNYLFELSIQYNTHSWCEHITSGVNIYLYGHVSLLLHKCAVCYCVSVWYQIIVPAKLCTKLSNLIRCCIKHRARCF